MVEKPHLGLVGWPLGHSFSPQYFKEKFRREEIDGRYELFPCRTSTEIRGIIENNPDLQGFNVTIPYKQAVIPMLDWIEPGAEEIGAVNTVKIERDRETKRIYLKGYNTDRIGFRESLLPLLEGRNIAKALVLGTGGASRAVAYALRELGIEVTFVSRDASKTEMSPVIEYSEVTPEIISEHLLIVNTTPLGMSPNPETAPDIPYSSLSPAHICYDLVYNPKTTLFLKKAKDRGAVVKNGLAMLHKQADAAWEIWSSK